jgi:hypothetical protein
LGSTTYGPFGQGGAGGTSTGITASSGNAGGVVLWWGSW